MEYRDGVENWWMDREFIEQVPRPQCSDYPNKVTQGAISDHDFFQSRSIRIPVQVGRKGTRLVEYAHLEAEAVMKPFLECECEMTTESAIQSEEQICVHGKIVNLSRGVGGDRSFFVHAVNSRGSYRVIAHICFGEESDTETTTPVQTEVRPEQSKKNA